jgi:hypothetical protein
LKPGQTVLLDLGTRNDEQRVEEEQADGKVVGRTDHYSRRALVFITARLAKAVTAKSEGKGFTTGQSRFRPGDSIKITQVQRGKKFITVTADYELASADRALIALHITSMKDTSGTRNAAEQSKHITRGKGTITLHHPATYEGMPHISFYPSPQGGQAFGGIYFGTKEEAYASQKLKLGYILDEKALSDRVYPYPGKAQTGAILEDLRRILDLDDKVADEKGSVTLKEADNSFHITATQLQHSWVEAYLLGLGRGQ